MHSLCITLYLLTVKRHFITPRFVKRTETDMNAYIYAGKQRRFRINSSWFSNGVNRFWDGLASSSCVGGH